MYRRLLRRAGRIECKPESGCRVNGKLPDGTIDHRKVCRSGYPCYDAIPKSKQIALQSKTEY